MISTWTIDVIPEGISQQHHTLRQKRRMICEKCKFVKFLGTYNNPAELLEYGTEYNSPIYENLCKECIPKLKEGVIIAIPIKDDLTMC